MAETQAGDVDEGFIDLSVLPDRSWFTPVGAEWEDAETLARLAAEHGPDMLVVADPKGVVRYVGKSAERILGIDPRMQSNTHLLHYVHPDDGTAVLSTMEHASSRAGYHQPVMVRVRRDDDGWVDCEVNCQTLPGPGGMWAIFSIRGVRDRGEIDERRAAVERLIQTASLECARVRWFEADDVAEHLLRSLAGLLGAREVELAWVADERDSQAPLTLGAHWVARVEENWVDAALTAIGATFEPLADPASSPVVALVDVVGLQRRSHSATVKRLMDAGLTSAVEIRLGHGLRSAILRLGFAGDPERWDNHNADVVMLIATIIMSTIRRCHAEESLSERARRDPLTGLLNRDELYKALASAIASPHQDGLVGVLYVDVDRFKQLNDRHGHALGDEVLRGVAAAMEDAVREGDVIARMGGDEFVAVCCDLESEENLLAVAHRLADRVAQLRTRGVGVGVSIGTAMWRSDMSQDDLVGLADADMYRDKRSRLSTPHRVDPDRSERHSDT
jgi:diguanylate cyclase (GGDEF)-like protein/PAS domain S-box-containing protein